MLKRIIFLLISSTICAFVQMSTMPACSADSADPDNNHPIEIQSNSAVLDDKKAMVTYHGNVIMKQGSRHLQSDRLIIRKDINGHLESMIASGNPAQFDLTPTAHTPPIHAEAKIIQYFPKEKKMVLLENATLSEADHTVLGEHLVYFLETRVLSAEPSSKQATLRFAPQEQRP